MSKRSSTITKKAISQSSMMRKLEREPNRYRVGATVDINSRMSAYNGERKYHGKTAYYAPSKIPAVKEEKMLGKLPDSHRHNDQKHSNHSGGQGYVYMVDTKK